MRCDHNQPIPGDCAECEAIEENPPQTGAPFFGCRACHGRRGAPEHNRYDDCCEACYEDGGPHAGEDPFGRSDEDWKRHAE
jgi:hypothetical protein